MGSGANSAAVPGYRIRSIDIVRGIIMVIMALDHTRDILHKGSITNNPLDLTVTTPALFFTRWITHICAPGFVFLAGLSAFLFGKKYDTGKLRSFLISRGIFLIIVDAVLMSFILSLNPSYGMIVLSVLWAIGISMIVLGFLCKLPVKIILLAGILIIGLHHLVNPVVSNTGTFTGVAQAFTLSIPSVISLSKGHLLLVAYSFLPWTGVMLLGYGFGKLFSTDYTPAVRIKILLFAGLSFIVLFILLRWLNFYGDLIPWSVQKSYLFTILYFLNTNKYPPSLLFVLMTLGLVLLGLAFSENVKGRIANFLMVYGRVPFFYYLIHFFIIRLASVILFYAQGFISTQINTPPFFFHPEEYGLRLRYVYLVWITVVILMFPLCKFYGRYKKAHPEIKWLKYL